MIERNTPLNKRKLIGLMLMCSLSSWLTALPAHSALIPDGPPTTLVPKGTEAIVGSGREAIVGSGKEAIVGSGKEAAEITDSVFGPILSGPITAVNKKGKTITVLDVEIKLLKSTIFASNNLDSLAVGDWVTITGMTHGRAIFASQVVLQPDTFVTGVSTVFVAGDITDISLEIGYAEIAGVQVYLTEAAEISELGLRIGDYVEGFGTLPQIGQPISLERLAKAE